MRKLLSSIKYSFLALPYIGLRFQCPVCRWRFRKLLDYGVENRAHARCPRCFSLERHRMIFIFLKRRTVFFKAPLEVLHFAPEYVYKAIFEGLPNLQYVTADLYDKNVMYTMDITDIKFPDQQFDVILCNHVLEHVEDDQKAMRELYRVLKPGGWAILVSPVDKGREATYEDPGITDPQERLKHFGQDNHVRIYGRDYVDRLRAAGFQVEVIDYALELRDDRQKFALHGDDDIYYCTKSHKF
jgi:SAM-dependent methyltransferase